MWTQGPPSINPTQSPLLRTDVRFPRRMPRNGPCALLFTLTPRVTFLRVSWPLEGLIGVKLNHSALLIANEPDPLLQGVDGTGGRDTAQLTRAEELQREGSLCSIPPLSFTEMPCLLTNCFLHNSVLNMTMRHHSASV